MDPLTLQYEVTLDEVVELQLYEARRAGTVRRARRTQLISWAVLFGGSEAWLLHMGMEGRVASLIGFFMALFVLTVLALVPTGIRNELRRSVIHLGGTFPKRLEAGITEAGFQLSSAEGVTANVPWALVQAPLVGSGYVAVPLTNHHPVFIPTRAFPSNQVQDAFVGKVRELRASVSRGEEEGVSPSFPPLPGAPGSGYTASNGLFLYTAIVGSLSPLAPMLIIARSSARMYAPAWNTLPALIRFIGSGGALAGSVLVLPLIMGASFATSTPTRRRSLMFGAALLGVALIVLSVVGALEVPTPG